MNTNANGSGHVTGHEPELLGTKAAIEKELVFLELKDEVRERFDLPSHVPILRTDVAEAEKRGGDIPVAAFAAGVEALKLLQPGASGYDRFLARYYLLEGERNLQEVTRDLYQAQRYLQKSLDLEQDTISAEAAYYLATVVQPDDPELALNLYRRSIELNPNAATPHFELGILLRERRDLAAALDEFEAAFKLDPTSANLLNEVGDTHIQAGDWNKAVASFRRAAELEPEYWALPVKLGMAEFRNGENAAAIRDLRRGLDNAPDELSDDYDMQMYVEGLYYLALAYAEMGRPDQSRKLYRAILEIDPTHQGANTGLAQG